VSRGDEERIGDVLDAIAAIRSHLERGNLADGLVFDAVCLRLIEIGEAIKGVTPTLLGTEPGTSWVDITGMRDWLAHRYFDTSHAIVQATVEEDLPTLEAVVLRLRASLGPGSR
jgi:uncharacterized protein with HEPN domain